MSFTGDLNHLPIVDVIQLLHATKKSGTLTVQGRRGQCILVFSDGYIVGGRHARKAVHLGQILVEQRKLAAETCARLVQEQAGKPLAALLLAGGHVKPEEVVRGLETLIELAIVEVLTWSGGTFTLEVDRVELFDDFAYLQEQQQEAVFSTQNVLMDALRIYDEKKRDGELTDEEAEEESGEAESPAAAAAAPAADWTLSAADLGLADVDRLEKKIPGVFSCLPDINPLDLHRQKMGEVAPELDAAEQESLLATLQQLTERILADKGAEGGRGRVILYTPDELFQYMITAASKDSGVFIFASNKEGDLVPIIEQSLGKDNGTLLVFDRPDPRKPGFSMEKLISLRRQLKQDYPRLPVIQLAPPTDFAFTLQAYEDGIRTVFPRPLPAERRETFVADFSRFLAGFRKHLQGFARAQGEKSIGRLNRQLLAMRDLREAPEIALAVLRFVAAHFPRALTLVVTPGELVGERAIGCAGEGTEARLTLRIPLAKESIFARVIEEGRLFHGPGEDRLLQEYLFKAIGAPVRPLCLLLPLQSRGRTVALTYADFAAREVAQVQTELLEILARHAGLLLDMGRPAQKA